MVLDIMTIYVITTLQYGPLTGILLTLRIFQTLFPALALSHHVADYQHRLYNRDLVHHETFYLQLCEQIRRLLLLHQTSVNIESHHLWQIHTSQVKRDGSNRNVIVRLKDHISNQLRSLPWAGHWRSSFQAHWLFGLNVNWFKWINFTEKTQRTQKDVTNFCEAKQGWIE